jgi:hypothetical protein
LHYSNICRQSIYWLCLKTWMVDAIYLSSLELIGTHFSSY